VQQICEVHTEEIGLNDPHVLELFSLEHGCQVAIDFDGDNAAGTRREGSCERSAPRPDFENVSSFVA